MDINLVFLYLQMAEKSTKGIPCSAVKGGVTHQIQIRK